MNILLVEPEFPIPNKSRNHKNFLPVGLLKIASYYKSENHRIALIRGNKKRDEIEFYPDHILITSLFTYWRKYVKESVEHYRTLFPAARIVVGGIYASLMPEDCAKYTKCDEVHRGVFEEAERFQPAYDLIANPHNVGYQIIHASRGCIRNCEFCGVRKIEPKFTYKKSIKKEICSNKLIFYDNNLLANPYIEEILEEIASSKFKGKSVTCESQCGFDGRLLTTKLARLIKKARFRNPRIAWDGPYSEFKEIKRQLDLLIDAGYSSRDIFIFMLFNWELDFEEMERKRKRCWEWKVQIADCRYRPLDQPYDNYNPWKKQPQSNNDYYIHPKWIDGLVKKFRRNVRRQNICVRMGFREYSRELEERGRQHRMVREEITSQLKDKDYADFTVRQLSKKKEGWSARVRIAKEYYEVRLSSNNQIENISELTKKAS